MRYGTLPPNPQHIVAPVYTQTNPTMTISSERIPVRDLDAEAKKAREAVEKAKTEYILALTNTESLAELKELLKSGLDWSYLTLKGTYEGIRTV